MRHFYCSLIKKKKSQKNVSSVIKCSNQKLSFEVIWKKKSITMFVLNCFLVFCQKSSTYCWSLSKDKLHLEQWYSAKRYLSSISFSNKTAIVNLFIKKTKYILILCRFTRSKLKIYSKSCRQMHESNPTRAMFLSSVMFSSSRHWTSSRRSTIRYKNEVSSDIFSFLWIIFLDENFCVYLWQDTRICWSFLAKITYRINFEVSFLVLRLSDVLVYFCVA